MADKFIHGSKEIFCLHLAHLDVIEQYYQHFVAPFSVNHKQHVCKDFQSQVTDLKSEIRLLVKVNETYCPWLDMLEHIIKLSFDASIKLVFEHIQCQRLVLNPDILQVYHLFPFLMDEHHVYFHRSAHIVSTLVWCLLDVEGSIIFLVCYNFHGAGSLL